MSQITESIAQVQASLNQLIRVVEIQEAMEKQDHAHARKQLRRLMSLEQQENSSGIRTVKLFMELDFISLQIFVGMPVQFTR